MTRHSTLAAPAAAVLALVAACGKTPPPAPAPTTEEAISGTVIVFHAGSLSVPFKALKERFEAANPGVTVQLESAGSRECARKITELGRPCDLLASADYLVIDDLLIPTHASWNAKFAQNEMVIAYKEGARAADRIDSNNWFDVLLSPGVQYGHADPNADPCGYRALMTWQLAERHRAAPGLYDRLVAGCPPKNVRPKEVDMLALIEAGELDYLFIYRSVAEQHGLKFVALPDEVNLRSPTLAPLYATASVVVSGSAPGETAVVGGTPMVYGFTIPKNAPNPRAAAALAVFLAGPEGRSIMEESRQPPISPVLIRGFEAAPQEVRALGTPDPAEAPPAPAPAAAEGATAPDTTAPRTPPA